MCAKRDVFVVSFDCILKGLCHSCVTAYYVLPNTHYET